MINYKDKCYYVSSDQLRESEAMEFHVAVLFADALQKDGHTHVSLHKGQMVLEI
jgi:hypothetical protein